jgi:hypothetical protein
MILPAGPVQQYELLNHNYEEQFAGQYNEAVFFHGNQLLF